MNVERWWNDDWQGKAKVLGEDPFPLPLDQKFHTVTSRDRKVKEQIRKKACLQEIDRSWWNWRQYQKPDFLRSCSTGTEFSVCRRRICPRTVMTPKPKYKIGFSKHLFFWRISPHWTRASSFTSILDHTQRRTRLGRSPLDEWSARRRDLYLTTHNIHNRHQCPRWDSNPTVSAGKRPHAYALDCAETGTGSRNNYKYLFYYKTVFLLVIISTAMLDFFTRHGCCQYFNSAKLCEASIWRFEV